MIPVGFPSDDQLQDLMKHVHLGMVHSRWEGFGLPLAEMQWLGRPVLAFADGAHPEVAADPKILCRTNDEMIRKACEILQGSPTALVPAEAYDRFREQFTWERVLHELQELIEGIRDYATELFGPLAPTVFRNWGLTATQDFGDIVFNLVENDLLNKTDADRREDFANGFDFDTAFDGPVEVKPQ